MKMIETTVIVCAVLVLMMSAKRMTKKETEAWLADVSGSSGGTFVKVWSVKPGESDTFVFDKITFGTGEEISLRGWGFPLWSLHKHGAFLVDTQKDGSEIDGYGTESPARFVTNRAWRQIAELILKARVEGGLIDSEIETKAPEGAEDILRWAYPNGKESKDGLKANALSVTISRAEKGRDGTAQTAPYSVTDFAVVDRI